MKKTILILVIGLWLIHSFYISAIERKNDKVFTQQYNKTYSVKNPDKVAIVNNYYDCLSSSKSAIEGCEVHVAQTKADTVAVNDYLSGLKQYVEKKKNN